MSRVLKVHPLDNVGVALEELKAGDVVILGGQEIKIIDHVPVGHKFALRYIHNGTKVIKYGQPIGRASQDIAQGAHVHVHNLQSGRKFGDTAIPIPTIPNPLEALLDSLPREFLGYLRRDGRVGVRNHVLVLATVHCANGVVERIGKEVPEVVPLAHIYGCSQLGEDLIQTRQVLESYAAHPNVGAALLIGLGCETMPTEEMADKLAERNVEVRCLLIQREGGSRSTVERGKRFLRELIQKTRKIRREPVPVSKLVVGLECGGSDAWSGITANPAVGVVSDAIVALGGTVILSEVTEFIGAEQILAARAVDAKVAQEILQAVERREAAARVMGVDLRGAQPSPGNMEGGLTTIEEKSLGAITKGGTSSIQEFLRYGQSPSRSGLVVMDTSGNDLESVTAMVAGGAQAILFTTGRGTPVGNPIAPVIKIASNTTVYKKMADDIDFNAGTVLDGEPYVEVGRSIFMFLLKVANGKLTASERWRHREFAIEPRGPKV